MYSCDHQGEQQYARRIFANGTVHICVQCLACGQVVKLARHNNRPFIRLSEVPLDARIHEWVDPDNMGTV